MTFPGHIDVAALAAGEGFVVEGINPFFGNGVGSGGAVAAAGDLNGDGIGDIVIGAERVVSLDPVTGQQQFTAGEAYVVFGRRDGFPLSVDPAALDGTTGFRLTGGREAQGLGFDVSAAGDVNGDGVDDLLLGTRATSLGQSAEPGEAFLVFGRAGGGFAPVTAIDALAPGQGVRLLDPNPSIPGQLGRSVTGIGDFDGDGIADLAIGEAKSGNPARASVEAGAVHVILGGTTAFPSAGTPQQMPRAVSYYGPLADAGLGTDVAGIGDFNGDGRDDLIAVAPGAPFRSPTERFATVLFGDATIPANGTFGQDLTFLPQDASAGFLIRNLADQAARAAAAGDVNGDGLADLIVGGPNAFNGTGFAAVLYGTRTPEYSVDLQALTPDQGFLITGVQPAGFFGAAVGAAGDINNDGYDDVIIGAEGANRTPIPNRTEDYLGGAAYVVFGGPTGATLSVGDLDGTNGFAISGISPFSTHPDDRLGAAVAGGVDVNGDGIDDLLIGAEDAGSAPGDLQSVRAGRTYVLFGRQEAPVRDGTAAGEELRGDARAEILNGLAGNDDLFGAEGNDTLRGGEGDDRLFGWTGDDLAEGGAGDDELYGDAGNDTLDGGAGTDFVGIDADRAGFTLARDGQGRVTVTETATGETDTLIAVEGLGFRDGFVPLTPGVAGSWHYGTPFDDAIAGTAGADGLFGDAGSDTLTGGDGDDYFHVIAADGSDTLDGGAGNDFAGVQAPRDGYAIAQTGADRFTLTAPDGSVDTLIGVEALGFAGGVYVGLIVQTFTNDDGTTWNQGTFRADTITATAASDGLRGGDGDDTLQGGAGDDYLEGEGGADRLEGGPGVDYAYYAAARAGFTLAQTGDGAVTVTETTSGSVDTLVGVEAIGFTDQAVVVVAPQWWGDFLEGSVFDDTLTGRATTDGIAGGVGNDRLDGAGSGDFLDGGVGADTLIGGAGDDFLVGGAGADTFVFSGTSGFDRIDDFEPGTDTIRLDTGTPFAFFEDPSGDAWLSLGAESGVLLTGVDPATATADWLTIG